jgi:four helix bundle protein
MQFAESYRDLEVYKLSRQISREIFEISKTFPREETYSLTDQVRRASRSVGAQIAEAWAKRKYEKHFISKLTDADGELEETQHWIEIAVDCHYISSEISSNLKAKCISVSKMIHAMINKSAQFCGK